jgi:hypothetical protein
LSKGSGIRRAIQAGGFTGEEVRKKKEEEERGKRKEERGKRKEERGKRKDMPRDFSPRVNQKRVRQKHRPGIMAAPAALKPPACV